MTQNAQRPKTDSPHVGKLLEFPRENILCPGCRKLLGERIGPLFLSTYHQRFFGGPLPAFIRCEDCGGIWENDNWDGNLAEVVMFLRSELPRQDLPERNWDAVPREKWGRRKVEAQA